MALRPEVTLEQLRLVSELADDRWLSHQFLFKKRHPIDSPKFHEEMIDLFHGPERRVVMQTFRDGAKSTISEEEVILGALYKEFENCILIGSSFDRACDRLRAIKNEIANNEKIINVYGNQTGPVWAESKIVLRNGVVIQAFGRDQSLRGCKHLDVRPDFCVIDDLEDEETAKSLESISRTMKWMMGVLVPALQQKARIRMIGTPLHPKCVIVQLSADPEWVSRIWPIEYMDEEGRRATWPAKFPLETIDKIRARNMRVGTMSSFNQEYLCKAEDEEAKPFKPDMVRVEPTARSWHATWACYDPARTVKEKSAQTGKAVWSWIGNRLVVWEASGHYWQPDAIIEDIMQTNRQYNPVGVGVEKEGLEQFIEQPLRQAMVKNQEIVPLVKITAPAGKNDFIKSLQPFFLAGEIVLAREMPDLVSQMMAFPSGLKDILNALAYALKMRPGIPVYEDFAAVHVSENIRPFTGRPYWLCLNAADGLVSGILCQMEGGRLRIFSDWVREGEMAESIKDIMTLSSIESEGRLRVMAAPKTLDPYSNTGMKMAAKHKNINVLRGMDPVIGREQVRGMLRTLRAGLPEIAVSADARWTLRAFSAGYALGLDGVALQGPYRLLMEGMESFAALMKAGFMTENDASRHYASTSDGRRYLTSRPMGHA